MNLLVNIVICVWRRSGSISCKVGAHCEIEFDKQSKLRAAKNLLQLRELREIQVTMPVLG